MHGGAAPQVLRKARERLQLAADDAISYLVRVLSDESLEPALRVKVALEIASRTGNVAGLKMDVDQQVSLSFADRVTIIEVLDSFGGDREAALGVLQDPAALEQFQTESGEALVSEDPQLQRVLERAGLAGDKYSGTAEPAELPSVAVRRMLERHAAAPVETEVLEGEVLPPEDYRDPDSTPPTATPGPPSGPRVRSARVQR